MSPAEEKRARVPADQVALATEVCRAIAVDVAQRYLVPLDLVFAKTRGCKRIEVARKLIMHRAKATSDLSVSAIGAAMGRDHTRVLRAAKENEHALREYLRRHRMQPLTETEADQHIALAAITGTNYDTREAFEKMRRYLARGGDRTLWALFCKHAWPHTAAAQFAALPQGVSE